MRSTVINNEFSIPFNSVRNQLICSIEERNFLLLHEINTQEIVAKHNVDIAPLVQLLFFKPEYIAQIIQQDPLAINDIPLKFVIRELKSGSTSVSFQNPFENLKGYNLIQEISECLYLEINEIIDGLIA